MIAARLVPSPIGPLTLVASDEALIGLYFPDRGPPVPAADDPRHPILAQAARELAAYFAGTLRAFTVPLAPEGTPFQQLAWRALRDIPYAETRTYGEQAARIGRPTASRAVGAANGANPISIIVPCHRVIGASGALTGFGGGLPTKQWLLAHEAKQLTLF
jgi:methylated-DNA-[protein]-cysteine S-methyltransferase